MLDLGPGRPGGSPCFVNSPHEAASAVGQFQLSVYQQCSCEYCDIPPLKVASFGLATLILVFGYFKPSCGALEPSLNET